jgi:hypothetical protein
MSALVILASGIIITAAAMFERNVRKTLRRSEGVGP